MKRLVMLGAAIVVGLTTLATAQPKQANATSKIHLRPGTTVYAAESRAVAFAPCETPPGTSGWQGTFPKPKLDANGVPKTLFSYRAGDPLKVVSMHNYTWTYEGNHFAEKFWTIETRDHHRFCLRDAQVDGSVVETPHGK